LPPGVRRCHLYRLLDLRLRLHLRLRLRLNRRRRRLLRRRWWLLLGCRRGRLHRLWFSASGRDLARRFPDDGHFLGLSNAEAQKRETKTNS
jgi:hypothetical protein